MDFLVTEDFSIVTISWHQYAPIRPKSYSKIFTDVFHTLKLKIKAPDRRRFLTMQAKVLFVKNIILATT